MKKKANTPSPYQTGSHVSTDGRMIYIEQYNPESGDYFVRTGFRFEENHKQNPVESWLSHEDLDDRYGPLTHINNLAPTTDVTL